MQIFFLRPDADCRSAFKSPDFYNGGITGALAKWMERGSEVEVGGVDGGLGRPSDKHLTPAPRRCGLNVACLLRAGFGNRGLSGPSPLQEPLRDCHGMEPMH